MKKADLHIHTTFSDGTYTPEEVVKEAARKGLSAISITDHDITDGIIPALKCASKIGIEVIPGVELSCEYKSKEIHVVGYYINWENKWFQHKLEVFQKARERRAYHILNKLRDIGVDIDEQMLFSMTSMGSISRMHFARCLVQAGYVKTHAEAFDRFLGAGCGAFVRKLRITPEEALNMIHRVGGVSVIAHPVFGGGHKNFLKKLKKMGLTGIEARYPHHSPAQTKKYERFARELDLTVTGGTDSHGSSESEMPIGSLSVDIKAVEDLKKARDIQEAKNKVILDYCSDKDES